MKATTVFIRSYRNDKVQTTHYFG